MADRVVERLIVAVGARSDGASMRSAVSAYTSLSAAVFAAGAAVAAFSVAQAASIDVTAKTARTLALTTEEYTALAYAADRSGVSSELLGTSLRALQMQTQAAASGSKEAAKLFSGLGVSIRDANGDVRTSADLLPDLADGLKALPDGERIGVSLRLLGEGGARMATLIGEGSDGIERLTDRAHALSVVLDSKTALAGERLTDSMTDLRAALGGMGRQIAAVTMPATADLADSLTGILTQSDGIVQVGLGRAMRAIGVAMDFARTPAGKAALSLSAVGTAIGIARGAPGLIQGLSQASPLIGGMASKMGAGALAAGPYVAALALAALVIDDVIVTAQGGDSAIRALADTMGAGEETAYALAEAGGVLSSAWEAVPGIMRGVGLALQPLIDDLPKPLKAIAEWIESITLNLPSLAGAMQGIGDWFGRGAEGWSQLARFAAGDQTLEFAPEQGNSNVIGGALTTGLANSLGRAAGLGRDRDAIDRYRALAATPMEGTRLGGMPSAATVTQSAPVSVSLNVSSDPRTAARQAGRETERQVYDAMSSLEAL